MKSQFHLPNLLPLIVLPFGCLQFDYLERLIIFLVVISVVSITAVYYALYLFVQMAFYLIPSRYSYLRLVQRFLFTGKAKFLLMLIVIGFLLLYLFKTSSQDDDYNMSLNSYEFQEKLASSLEYSNFAVLIDAGSSGSRVHLYTWPQFSGDTRGLIKVKMVKDAKGHELSQKITPGLSSLASNPQDAFKYIYPLLSFAQEHIPASKHHSTPLYILATAGMRLLSIEQQKAIVDTLRDHLKSNSSFLFSPNNIQVITGKDEGIYSWISVNYLLGRFEHSVSPKSLVAINLGNGITTRPRTVGMLEMGGASVQIAFEITSKYELDEIMRRRDAKSKEDLKEVVAQFNLGSTPYDTNHNYMLYVTTFLGLGANVAREAYIKFLIDQQKRIHLPPVKSDKLHPIIKETFALKHSKYLKLSDPCMCKNCPLNLTAVSIEGQTYNLSLIGLGNFEHCEATLKKLINPTQERSALCKFNVTCPLKELANTRISFGDAEFYGFSELWYSMEDVLRIGGRYNYFTFKKTASDYCSTEFKVLKERLAKNLYPNADEHRLIEECFKAAWITTVLHVGFKMPKNYQNYQSALAINSNQVQWTLGALLYRFRPSSPHVFEKDFQSQRAVSGDLYSFKFVVFLFFMLIVIAVIVIYLPPTFIK